MDALFSKEIEISNEDQSVDVGALRLCDELSNFILFEVDGREAHIFEPVSVEIIEFDDPNGESVYRVTLTHQGDGGSNDTLAQRALMSIGLTNPTLELVDGIQISFVDDTFFCETNFDDIPLSDLTLTSVGVETGDVLAGTFSTTSITCLDWLTAEVFEGQVVEGQFSVTIE